MAGSRLDLNGPGGALRLTVGVERWAIRGGFTIARGVKREAIVVVAEIGDGTHRGRGECVPYGRYGESVEGVVEAIETCGPRDQARFRTGRASPPSCRPARRATRSTAPCGIWRPSGRVEAPRRWPGCRPCIRCRRPSPSPLATLRLWRHRRRLRLGIPLLKLKLGGAGDRDRLAAVRAAVPHARLIADANEAWQAHETESLLAAAAKAGVELVEQPLPAGEDALLAQIAHAVPICADESVHDRASLAALAGRYDAVNIKLDKTGGLTEALLVASLARTLGLKIMVGSMVATSLSMAPALLLAQDADWVDLDGPLLLEADRTPGLTYEAEIVSPPTPDLWG